MLAQALSAGFNTHLSATVLIGVTILGITAGFFAGRWSMYLRATHDLQLALQRAARDIRLFRENRVAYAPKAAPYRLLVEAEYILEWRSRDGNHLVKPSGESRMAPEGVPRAEITQLHREREKRRNIIKQYAINPNFKGDPDEDTGAVNLRTKINRRYQ